MNKAKVFGCIAAAMMMAARADMQRVTTQVAMALGASVQPLTKITPSVSTTDIRSNGFASIWLIKSCISIGVTSYLGLGRVYYHYYTQPYCES